MNDIEIEEYVNGLTDSEFEELLDAVREDAQSECIGTTISELMEKHEDMPRDQAIAKAYNMCDTGETKSDTIAWLTEDSEFGTVNKLNNVLKIPVILAREMVQGYGEKKHFKPYDELVKAIDSLEDLPVIIEHKNWTDDDVVGYVKEFKSDDDDRSIKGVAYLTEGSLPEAIADTLKKNMVVPISIGFWADLQEGGEFNGEKYDSTQRNMALNHLAICIRSIARCPPNKCGLNLDSEESPEMLEDTLIKKGNQYYYIFKEENEKIIQNQEIGDNMGDIRNFPTDQTYIPIDENNPTSTAPSGQLATAGKDILSALSKLIDFTGYISKADIRQDAEDLLLSLINSIKDGEKMGDNEELTKLESRINQLEDSIKEKDEVISKYEEEKKAALIDSIKKFTVFEDGELEGKCVNELAIISDTVSKFEPSMAKPKTLPKKEQTKQESIADARLSPYVFGRDGFKEDE